MGHSEEQGERPLRSLPTARDFTSFVIGFLGMVGIVYLLTHLFSIVTATSVLDDQLRIVWQTIRYRM
jgi:hypothetical protein